MADKDDVCEHLINFMNIVNKAVDVAIKINIEYNDAVQILYEHFRITVETKF